MLGAEYGLLSIYMTYSILLTWRKYKLITQRTTFENYDQSYCLFSKMLVQIVLFGQPVCVVVLFYNSVKFMQPYTRDDLSQCHGKVFNLEHITNNSFEAILVSALLICCDLICFVQGFEWLVMLILVRT